VVPRVRTRIVTIFGVAALLLTLAGLYARVSYAATSRARELAIRQAIGARPLEVIRLVAGEALAVTLAGAAIGVALLPSTLSLLRPAVGVLPAASGSSATAVAILFVLAATCSAYGPARRAGRAHLAELLRAD
jgi:putative ABC transport system permease protein